MELSWEKFELYDLTWDQIEKLDMTWDELGSVSREEFIKKVVSVKIDDIPAEDNESKDTSFWEKLSLVVDVNNRYTEYKLIKSHDIIQQLHKTIAKQEHTISDLQAANKSIQNTLDAEQLYRKSTEGWNKFLGITTILGTIVGILGLIYAFFK